MEIIHYLGIFQHYLNVYSVYFRSLSSSTIIMDEEREQAIIIIKINGRGRRPSYVIMDKEREQAIIMNEQREQAIIYNGWGERISNYNWRGETASYYIQCMKREKKLYINVWGDLERTNYYNNKN